MPRVAKGKDRYHRCCWLENLKERLGLALAYTCTTGSSLWSGRWSVLSDCHTRITRQMVVGVVGREGQFAEARVRASAVTERRKGFWETPNNSYTEKPEWDLAYDLAVNHRVTEVWNGRVWSIWFHHPSVETEGQKGLMICPRPQTPDAHYTGFLYSWICQCSSTAWIWFPAKFFIENPYLVDLSFCQWMMR